MQTLPYANGLMIAMPMIALALTSCGGALRVCAGKTPIGTFTDVECELKGFESPRRPYLKATVRTPCDTIAPTTVTVIRGSDVLSNVEIRDGLTTARVNELQTGAFDDPGRGERVQIEVYATCKSGERQHGSDECQMP
jgi:hypothetical protein